MRRDRDEELRRLQEQLLEEDEPEADELLDEETVEELLEDNRVSEGHRVYQNFSNGYGKQLRNYASGYKAYNSDVTDTDLQRYSEEVRQPKKNGCLGFLVAMMLVLTAVAVLLFWYWKQGGHF